MERPLSRCKLLKSYDHQQIAAMGTSGRIITRINVGFAQTARSLIPNLPIREVPPGSRYFQVVDMGGLSSGQPFLLGQRRRC